MILTMETGSKFGLNIITYSQILATLFHFQHVSHQQLSTHWLCIFFLMVCIEWADSAHNLYLGYWEMRQRGIRGWLKENSI